MCIFQNSFTEVAKLFTEFFRDLDVVPSDVVAGLVLLRRHQKLRRKVIVGQVWSPSYFVIFYIQDFLCCPSKKVWK